MNRQRTVIEASDLRYSSRFYESLLGGRFASAGDGDGSLVMSWGGMTVVLVPSVTERAGFLHHGTTVLEIVTGDIAGLAEWLRRRHILHECVSPVELHVHDPDNNIIRITQR